MEMHVPVTKPMRYIELAFPQKARTPVQDALMEFNQKHVSGLKVIHDDRIGDARYWVIVVNEDVADQMLAVIADVIKPFPEPSHEDWLTAKRRAAGRAQDAVVAKPSP
jgi:hypothetical protein